MSWVWVWHDSVKWLKSAVYVTFQFVNQVATEGRDLSCVLCMLVWHDVFFRNAKFRTHHSPCMGRDDRLAVLRFGWARRH